ncbi:MAG TPA: S8 family serine peptidase [Polyangiales bacterium]|nr:S8 family serine peptidase [Polyangiales bacterium]
MRNLDSLSLLVRRGLIGMLAAATLGCTQAHTGLDLTPTANEKVPTPLIRSLNVGVARDVLVEFVPEGSTDALRDAGAVGGNAEGLVRDNGDLPTNVASSLIDEDLEAKAKYYEAAQEAIIDSIDEREVKVLTRYEHIPYLFVNVSTLRGLYAIAARPEVLRLYEDKEYEHQLVESLPLINQPAVAASGKTGANTAVAVLDTGCDFTRTDFGSCPEAGATGCKVAFAKDLTSSDDFQADDTGHGTNVSAIVLGVAPATKVLALDVFEKTGLANTSVILAGVDWSIKNRTTYNIVAMNLSLGGSSSNTLCTTSAFASALANARAAGIVPVVSSGNGGLTGALAIPACVPAAVSVGAVYDSNAGGFNFSGCSDRTTAADQVACFSNSASFLSLLAPGAPITAGGFRMLGTSQAAPHVAGAIAVVRAAFPGEAVNTSIARLTDSGAAIRDARNGITKRRLDLQAALKGASSKDTTAPTGSLAINGNQANTNKRAVTLALTGTDENGVDSMCVSNAGSCSAFESFSATKTWQLTDGDGLKTVRVALKDAAGNQGVVTDTIRLDTIGPTGSVLQAAPKDRAMELSWTAGSDTGSGVAGYRLVVAETTAPASCSTGSLIYNGNARSFKHTSLTNGTLLGYRLCPVDLAGNLGTGSVTSARATPELVPPTGAVKINGGARVTRVEGVTLNLNATDTSGVAQMCISNTSDTCTRWEPFSATKAWSLAASRGKGSVFVWFEDIYGNRSRTPATVNIIVDTEPPAAVTLTVTGGPSRVNLTWPAASDVSGIGSYTLLYTPGLLAPTQCTNGTKLYEGPLRSYTHMGLTTGSAYSYRLCATDKVGNLSVGVVRTALAR